MCVQTKGEVLGRLRGVSVKMLMHHSRNSEQKQWDETLVLALSGMGRLLRAHLPLLVPMQAFPQVPVLPMLCVAAIRQTTHPASPMRACLHIIIPMVPCNAIVPVVLCQYSSKPVCSPPMLADRE